MQVVAHKCLTSRSQVFVTVYLIPQKYTLHHSGQANLEHKCSYV